MQLFIISSPSPQKKEIIGAYLNPIFGLGMMLTIIIKYIKQKVFLSYGQVGHEESNRVIKETVGLEKRNELQEKFSPESGPGNKIQCISGNSTVSWFE